LFTNNFLRTGFIIFYIHTACTFNVYSAIVFAIYEVVEKEKNSKNTELNNSNIYNWIFSEDYGGISAIIK
jgi:hypothetical protein